MQDRPCHLLFRSLKMAEPRDQHCVCQRHYRRPGLFAVGREAKKAILARLPALGPISYLLSTLGSTLLTSSRSGSFKCWRSRGYTPGWALRNRVPTARYHPCSATRLWSSSQMVLGGSCSGCRGNMSIWWASIQRPNPLQMPFEPPPQFRSSSAPHHGRQSCSIWASPHRLRGWRHALQLPEDQL